MTDEHLLRVRSETLNNYDNFFVIDLGNQRLKNHPKRIFYYSRGWRQKLIEVMKKKVGDVSTTLIFCQYRHEVDYWQKFFTSKGFDTLGCKGGEAREFSLKLGLIKSPDIIVATSVLGHGVNLPSVEQIFFTYPVNNKDFWIQMCARGGRRGESYVVHTFDYMGVSGYKVLNLMKTWAYYIWMNICN